jgi:hypothetical protein
MKIPLKEISIVFTAGAAGGLVNRIAIWFAGRFGISEFLGVKLAPPLSEGFLYTGIVWGGIWGLVFLVPVLKSSFYLRSLILSIFPTLVMLFVVFPFWLHKGALGFQLGQFTPALVVIFNFIWALVTAAWIKAVEEE